MVLPLLVQQDVEALENRVLASGVARSVRGRANLGQPGIREVLERLTHSLLVVAPYRHDLLQARRGRCVHANRLGEGVANAHMPN